MLQKLIPRRLATRLLVIFAIMISVILGIYAWRTAQTEFQSRLEIFKAQSDALTYQISVSSKRFIITSDFAELENIVLAFAQYPGVEALMILYDDGTPLVYAKNNGSDVVIDYAVDNQSIDKSTQGTIKQGANLVSTRSMKLGERELWIQLVRDNSQYELIRRNAIVESFTWALFSIGICLIILYYVLRSPMIQLRKAAHFSRTLATQHNQSLHVEYGGQEIIELGNALSSAANELTQRDKQLNKQRVMLDTIRQLQSEFIAYANVGEIFEKLLKTLLEQTHSEYGFIGEVLYTEAGLPYLKTYAICEASWNEKTRDFFTSKKTSGIEFYNLDSLLGEVIKSEENLICNDPEHHPAAAGIPIGHPPLHSFMGLPVHYGDGLVGMIGLANRDSGYEEVWIEDLKPLISTCGQLIDAYRNFQLRSNIEDALQDSRRMLLTVLDAIPVRVFWKDLEGRYLGCNRNFAVDANKQHSNEVIGLTDLDMPWSREAEQYRHDDRSVIEGGEALINYEEKQTAPDGKVHWLQTSKIPLTNNSGEIIGILGTYDDITERKLSQDIIQESERRLADAQRIAHLGNWESVFPRHNHSEFNRWSDQTFRILGLEPGEKEPSYELFLKYVHPEDSDRVWQYSELMISNNEDFNYECRVIPEEGEERYVSVSAELVRKDDGVRGVVGTIQDITERKEVEKLKDEFISTVSHELRTPLTSIRGSLGLVRGLIPEDDMPAKMTNLLDIAHNNTERLLHLINDILDISKIESGQLLLSYDTINLQEFLTQAVINNQHYADDVDILLLDDVGDLQIEADSERLMQIMNNLLSNAIKFSPKGSRVEIGATFENQHIEISVRDRGTGIPETYQSKLFEKFTQADSSNTRNISGTGLGLSISKALVEKHGGHIGFETFAGEGTRFYFVLPIAMEHQNKGV